jgi:uncharacterized protein (TIGR02246 family)
LVEVAPGSPNGDAGRVVKDFHPLRERAMREHKLCWLALLAVACYGLADAQEPKSAPVNNKTQGDAGTGVKKAAVKPSGPQQPGDKPAADSGVVKAVEQFAAAFNKHDAKQLAAAWSPDAIYTDRTTGDKISGRDQIEAAYTEIFSRRPHVGLSVTVHSIRMITPDVAQVEATVTVGDLAKGSDSSQPAIATEFSAILKQVKGRWLLDSGVETELPHVSPAHHPLSKLEWLVGEWVDESSGGPVVRNSFRWNKHHTFLIRAFHIEADGQLVREGTQVIGWDPAKQKIHSWVFGSEGGFAEGTWNEVDGGWSINLTGTMPDGSRAVVTQILKQTGPDTMTSQLVSSEINGELQPHKAPVKMSRSSASPTQQ